MSAGTRVYTVRLPIALVEAAEVTIRRRNLHTRGVPWSLSDWIRVCMEREDAKMSRSRRPRRKSRPAEKSVGGSPQRIEDNSAN